jgi:D-serine/D-alanine/glycine transporter
MPAGVAMSWVVLGFFAAMVVVLLLEADTRAALLVTPVWFVALGAVWHLRVGRSRTQPDELVDAM